MSDRDQIISAIITQYDTNSTEQARIQAINFCNSILAKMSIVDACALSQWNHPFVQYFGAVCIEYDIKWRWEELKHTFSDTLNFLLTSVRNNLFLNEKFISEKITKIIVDIKLKLYFDEDNGEIDLKDIEPLFTESKEYQVTLGMLIYRTLFEEVFEFNESYSDSKPLSLKLTKLKKSLTAHMSHLMSLCFQVSEALLKSEPRNEDLLKESIKTFNVFVSWADLREVLVSPMWASLFSLISIQDHRAGVFDGLLLLLSRQNLKEENKKEMLILFRQTPVIQEIAKILSLEMETNKELSLISFEKLASIVTSLGTIHLNVSSCNKVQTMPEHYFEFIELMAQLTTFCVYHSSANMIRDYSNFWKLFFAQGIFTKDFPVTHTQFAVDIVNKLLAAYGRMHIRKKVKKEDDDYDECWRDVSTFGSQLFQILSQKFPFQSLSYGLSLFSELAQLIAQNPCTLDQSQELHFDGIFLQVKHILNELPLSNDLLVEKVKENASEFLQLIFNAEAKSFYVAHQLLKLVSPFFRFYPLSKELLERTIEFLIKHCIFSQPQESIIHFSAESLTLRREGFISFLRLASLRNISLEEYIPYIVSRFNELQDRLTICEKAHVTEVLVSISNGFHHYEKQQEFLAQILNDQVERWCTDMAPLLESPYNFLNFFGINQLSETDIQGNEAVLTRIDEFVLFVLGLVQTMKRVAIPTPKTSDNISIENDDNINVSPDILKEGRYLDENNSNYPIKHPLMFIEMKMLPNLLKLITILNSIYNPSLRENIPSDYQMIFFDGNINKLKETYRVDVFPENGSVVYTGKKQIISKLQQLREMVYHLFTAFCSHKVGFYPLDSIQDFLRDSVFGSDLHFTGFGNANDYLNKVIAPLMQNCPSYLFDTIVPLYCDFLVKYYSLILSEWNYNKLPNEKDEFIHDICKNNAISEFVNCIRYTLFPSKACTEFISYLFSSKVVQFGTFIQLMIDITNKKLNSFSADTAYSMIRSTLIHLRQIDPPSKLDILAQLFPLIIDQNLKLIDIELTALMFNVDHFFMRDLVYNLNVNKVTIKNEIQLARNPYKNIIEIKKAVKDNLEIMGYTGQMLTQVAQRA